MRRPRADRRRRGTRLRAVGRGWADSGRGWLRLTAVQLPHYRYLRVLSREIRAPHAQNAIIFLKNVDGLYDFYTESDKNVDGSIKALKNVTGIGKNPKVFSIFDNYGTKTVKTIEDVVGLIGG